MIEPYRVDGKTTIDENLMVNDAASAALVASMLYAGWDATSQPMPMFWYCDEQLSIEEVANKIASETEFDRETSFFLFVAMQSILSPGLENPRDLSEFAGILAALICDKAGDAR